LQGADLRALPLQARPPRVAARDGGARDLRAARGERGHARAGRGAPAPGRRRLPRVGGGAPRRVPDAVPRRGRARGGRRDREAPGRRSLAAGAEAANRRDRPLMRFGLFYEHQLPRPWREDGEERLLADALEQIELADRAGFDSVWEVEHHFLEEYSHSSAPEV